jgi:translation initiation factor 1
MAKNKSQGSNIVFSTDPSFSRQDELPSETQTLAPKDQILRVRLETKHRAGKAVTIVSGFEGTTADAEALGKKLKTFCGTGGSVKDGEILVQGDARDKIMSWLAKNGFDKAKKAGG